VAVSAAGGVVEWQVCGTCNYDCSYCIQKKKNRTGAPDRAKLDAILDSLERLPGRWEVKMSGGEPFTLPGFIDRVVARLAAGPLQVSVLTNFHAPREELCAFESLTREKLLVFSASLHLEFTTLGAFVEKAAAFRSELPDRVRFVVNSVVVPGRLKEQRAAKEALEARGLAYFPQVMKVGRGIAAYAPDEEEDLRALVAGGGNTAPSYRGRRCESGVRYFVLTWQGSAWSCRTAKRFAEGSLGSLADGDFALRAEPVVCPYDICPCTVPFHRGMIAQ